MSDCKSQDFGLLYKVKLALNLHALTFIIRYFSQGRIIIVKDVKSEILFSFVETLRGWTLWRLKNACLICFDFLLLSPKPRNWRLWAVEILKSYTFVRFGNILIGTDCGCRCGNVPKKATTRLGLINVLKRKRNICCQKYLRNTINNIERNYASPKFPVFLPYKQLPSLVPVTSPVEFIAR